MEKHSHTGKSIASKIPTTNAATYSIKQPTLRPPRPQPQLYLLTNHHLCIPQYMSRPCQVCKKRQRNFRCLFGFCSVCRLFDCTQSFENIKKPLPWPIAMVTTGSTAWLLSPRLLYRCSVAFFKGYFAPEIYTPLMQGSTGIREK